MQPSPGLYVHLPWCISKCPYCDFNSHALQGNPPMDAYVDALIDDLREQVQRYSPQPLASVFFGGGTPSLFSPHQIGRVLETANHLIGFTDGVEITLEANPGASEYSAFAGYLAAGVNRISLGVQSFANAQLKRLGRIHDDREVHKAINAVKASGIAQLNLDLMYGLPDQTVEMAIADVEQAIACEPTHLSHYNLTIEPNTLFAAQPPDLPDDDVCYTIQTECQKRLLSNGYAHYEVSAYAQDDCVSRHNLNYWRFGDYLGIGAGAHGKIRTAEQTVRTLKQKHPSQYLANATRLDTRIVTQEELLFEFMLNRLRLKSPFKVLDAVLHCPAATARLDDKLAQAHTRGLMEEMTAGVWQATPLGWRFLNDLQEIFLP